MWCGAVVGLAAVESFVCSGGWMVSSPFGGFEAGGFPVCSVGGWRVRSFVGWVGGCVSCLLRGEVAASSCLCVGEVVASSCLLRWGVGSSCLLRRGGWLGLHVCCVGGWLGFSPARRARLRGGRPQGRGARGRQSVCMEVRVAVACGAGFSGLARSPSRHGRHHSVRGGAGVTGVADNAGEAARLCNTCLTRHQNRHLVQPGSHNSIISLSSHTRHSLRRSRRRESLVSCVQRK